MRNYRNTIISEYRQADENERLHLFLNYRDLRMDFMEIEYEQVPDLFEKDPPVHRKPAVFRRLCTGVAAIVNSLV